jgi:hypothetical protein
MWVPEGIFKTRPRCRAIPPQHPVDPIKGVRRRRPLLCGRHRYCQRDVVNVAYGARYAPLAGQVIHQDDAAKFEAPHRGMVVSS